MLHGSMTKIITNLLALHAASMRHSCCNAAYMLVSCCNAAYTEFILIRLVVVCKYVTATFLLYRSASQTVAYSKSYENVFLNALTSSAKFLLILSSQFFFKFAIVKQLSNPPHLLSVIFTHHAIDTMTSSIHQYL